MLVGLIVEGVFDEAVFEVLVPRLAPGATTKIVRANGPVGPKLRRLLPSLTRYHVDFVVAVTDADKHAEQPQQFERWMADFATQCALLNPPPRPVVLVRELEALLLADPAAVNAICANPNRATRVGTPRPESLRSTESIADPKAELTTILNRFGIQYTAAVAAEIARAASIEALEQVCRQSFSQLTRALK